MSEEIPFWDRTLDLVILTHPDSDHLSGLNYVLRRYKVENILWSGVLRGTKTFLWWQENLEKEKANEIIAQAGQKIKAGNARILVLYPFKSLEGKFLEKSSNETSLIFQLLFGKNTSLFTGDTLVNVEKQLLESGIEVASQVLKVAHHGSKTSSSKEFLEKVAPEIAIISCGRNNPYGHPRQEVLKNLEEFGIKVLRTDQNGDIKIISDGDKFYARCSISNF